MSEATPRPWKAQRINWMGDPAPHEIFISGDEHLSEPDEDEEDEDAEPTAVATAVAIVCGNATSRSVTAANAALIVRAVNAHDDLVSTLQFALDCIGRHSILYRYDALLARLTRDIESVLAKANPTPPETVPRA